MIRFALIAALFLLSACRDGETPVTAAAKAQAPVTDRHFLLPGDWSQDTSLADLEAAFGKANVTVTEERDVLLFANDPTRRAYASFHDSEAMTDLRSLYVRDAASRWRGKHSVRVGMTLAELQAANGRPFIIYGFDAQQHGRVQDGWSPALEGDDGGLGALDVAEGERMYFEVDLGLAASAKDLPADALPRDDSILSNDPRYPRLAERVVVTRVGARTSLDDEWD